MEKYVLLFGNINVRKFVYFFFSRKNSYIITLNNISISTINVIHQLRLYLLTIAKIIILFSFLAKYSPQNKILWYNIYIDIPQNERINFCMICEPAEMSVYVIFLCKCANYTMKIMSVNFLRFRYPNFFC